MFIGVLTTQNKYDVPGDSDYETRKTFGRKARTNAATKNFQLVLTDKLEVNVI
jgi:hypothetical protein